MAITRITWSSLQLRFKTLLVALIFVCPAIWIDTSFASRGGKEVRNNLFTVAITYMDGGEQILCSGALIQPKVIATATHCVESAQGNLLTNYHFSIPGNSIEIGVSPSVLVRSIKSNEDISFIEIDKPLENGIPIRMADSKSISALTSNSGLSAYGFGAVYEDFTYYSEFPRKYPLTWVSSEPFLGKINTFEVTSTNSSACSGDSGGPVTTLINGEELLIGVMSGAAEVRGRCGTPGEDGLFRMKVVLIYPYQQLIPEPQISPTPSPTPVATPTKTSSVTKKSIICIKGKKQITVKAIKPKCPTCYKLKK